MIRTWTAMVIMASLLACRGAKSEQAPFHGFSDMDQQRRVDPQEPSTFFSDGRASRPLVEGTVARGHLRQNDAYERGRVGDQFLARAPIEVDVATLSRGQDRFDVYCAACHDRTGSGRGMVIVRGHPPPIDLSSERVRTMSDGEIFSTITHGVRNMPPHGKLIPVPDRWAIVTWVRVIQRSQHASVEDVPLALRDQIELEAPSP